MLNLQVRQDPPPENPYDCNYSSISGYGPASYINLQPTGSSYTIPTLKKPLEAGDRVGIRLTLISPEGLPGHEFTFDVIVEGMEGPGSSVLPARVVSRIPEEKSELGVMGTI